MHVLSLVIKNIDQWTAYVSPDWPEPVKKKSTYDLLYVKR